VRVDLYEPNGALLLPSSPSLLLYSTSTALILFVCQTRQRRCVYFAFVRWHVAGRRQWDFTGHILWSTCRLHTEHRHQMVDGWRTAFINACRSRMHVDQKICLNEHNEHAHSQHILTSLTFKADWLLRADLKLVWMSARPSACPPVYPQKVCPI